MMRQAGRTLPAYRALRERYGFLELVNRPELMARVTLMPLEVMDVDAAIMFADIMLPLASLGVKFDIVESIGPVIPDPIRSREQVDAMTRIPIEEAVPAVLECVRLVRSELGGRVPLIGFCGAPFTLACYLIEGKPSREFTLPKQMMLSEPDTWHALMERLTQMSIEYLTAQVEAGVQAVQLFDSWAGVLSPQDYACSALPYTRRIFEAISGVPRISFGTGTATLLELMASSGCEVVGADWRIPLDDAWERIGSHAIQGNLEPVVLLATPEVVRERTHDVLRRAGGRPGHIFNLGHGVLPGTPLDNMKLLVDTVHSWGGAAPPTSPPSRA
jgi:uroporphyrinogen decarboxylase